MSYLLSFFRDVFNIPALFANLYRQRELIQLLTWRDFLSKYKGSLIGWLWSVIQPLFMMALYTLVFSVFLKIRFGGSDSPYVFSVYLLCGLLPWTAFSEGIALATNLMRANVNLVKKVVFPLEVLPLNLTLVSLVQQLVGFVILLPLTYLVLKQLHWTLLLAPLILILQLLLTSGVTWLWTALAVYIPDVRQFTSILIYVLMFLTPIFYPEELVPEGMRFIIDVNPLAQIIRMYRQVFMTGDLPGLAATAYTLLACLFFFLFGYAAFMHAKKHFADFL